MCIRDRDGGRVALSLRSLDCIARGAASAPPAANEADLEGPGRAGGQGYVEADNRAAGGRPLHEPATRYVRLALFTHRILLLKLVGRLIQISEPTP